MRTNNIAFHVPVPLVLRGEEWVHPGLGFGIRGSAPARDRSL